jgi:hypothetical protein
VLCERIENKHIPNWIDFLKDKFIPGLPDKPYYPLEELLPHTFCEINHLRIENYTMKNLTNFLFYSRNS